MDSAQDSDLRPLFGDLSQLKKLSAIKPPLIMDLSSLLEDYYHPRTLLMVCTVYGLALVNPT